MRYGARGLFVISFQLMNKVERIYEGTDTTMFLYSLPGLFQLFPMELPRAPHHFVFYAFYTFVRCFN
jgi:hypothetical protein